MISRLLSPTSDHGWPTSQAEPLLAGREQRVDVYPALTSRDVRAALEWLETVATTPMSQSSTAVVTARTSLLRLWSPGTWTTVRRAVAGGMPNGSRVPCTTRVGTFTSSSSGRRLGLGAAPERWGG